MEVHVTEEYALAGQAVSRNNALLVLVFSWDLLILVLSVLV